MFYLLVYKTEEIDWRKNGESSHENSFFEIDVPKQLTKNLKSKCKEVLKTCNFIRDKSSLGINKIFSYVVCIVPVIKYTKNVNKQVNIKINIKITSTFSIQFCAFILFPCVLVKLVGAVHNL